MTHHRSDVIVENRGKLHRCVIAAGEPSRILVVPNERMPSHSLLVSLRKSHDGVRRAKIIAGWGGMNRAEFQGVFRLHLAEFSAKGIGIGRLVKESRRIDRGAHPDAAPVAEVAQRLAVKHGGQKDKYRHLKFHRKAPVPLTW